MKDVMNGIFEMVRWKILIIAMTLAAVVAFSVKALNLGTFVTLLISAVIYFGIYGIILILTGEPLI